MGYYSSFVVKVWVDDDLKMKRGYVQHVGANTTMHFLSFDKMVEFMLAHLGPNQNHGADVEADRESNSEA